MKTKIALGIAVIALTMVAIKSISPVLAYKGDASVKGPNYTEEKHKTNTIAFQKNDYKSWLTNMKVRGVTRYVTEANFKEYAKAQLASQKGDYSLINAFRTKYGMGSGKGNGCGGSEGHTTDHTNCPNHQ